MLYFILFVSILCLYQRVDSAPEEDDEFGGDLVAALTADRNLDLPVDEEYEDLRAELLAYHTVLANMVPGGPGAIIGDDGAVVTAATPTPVAAAGGRRSFKSTPCWQRGGVCMLKNLCIGPEYLTEVRGCRDKLDVCCFGWNRFFVRDFSDLGISNIALGNIPQEYGGKGVIVVTQKPKNDKKKKKKKRKTRKSVAVIIKNTSD